jgi:adenylate cyclase
MADVFVSYARSDKARVAPLVAAIEARGWSVWWDPQINPGQEFDQIIAEELKAAVAVLVVWTPKSVVSRWVRGEARDGVERGIIVPVRFEGASLPIDVRTLHTIDLDGCEQDPGSPQVQEVLRALGIIIAAQRVPQSETAILASGPSTSAQGSARAAICVLPFANMSGDPEQAYFSDGITEDIITELSRWHLLAVRSRSASFRYRGVAVDTKQVARELNARFIVEGSVRRMDARIRINAQLIDSETGSHLWAEKFDRDLADLFAVQDEVVRTIVSTLVGRVQAFGAERARRKPPASLEAYECLLQSNALPWDDPDGAAKATQLLRKAIEIDPDYGLAHALLAVLCLRTWENDASDSTLQEAVALAERAVELDKNESSCISILGQVYLLRRSFDLALQHLRRAVEMNPNNQWNVADVGTVLIYVGQAQEALVWLKRAKEIDPYFEPPWYWHLMGKAYMFLQQYEEALAAFGHLHTRPYRIAAHVAGCYARLADTDRTRVSVNEVLLMKPDFSITHFMTKQPFRNPGDAANLAESLRMAGLPD